MVSLRFKSTVETAVIKEVAQVEIKEKKKLTQIIFKIDEFFEDEEMFILQVFANK